MCILNICSNIKESYYTAVFHDDSLKRIFAVISLRFTCIYGVYPDKKIFENENFMNSEVKSQ